MLLQANSFHVSNELSCYIYSNQESCQKKFPKYCFGEEYFLNEIAFSRVSTALSLGNTLIQEKLPVVSGHMGWFVTVLLNSCLIPDAVWHSGLDRNWQSLCDLCAPVCAPCFVSTANQIPLPHFISMLKNTNALDWTVLYAALRDQRELLLYLSALKFILLIILELRAATCPSAKILL